MVVVNILNFARVPSYVFKELFISNNSFNSVDSVIMRLNMKS